MIRHAGYRAGALYSIMVGKIEYRVLIELRDHIHLTVATCCSHVLTESITIAAGGRVWYGCHNIGSGIFDSLCFVLTFFYIVIGLVHGAYLCFPVVQEGFHSAGQVSACSSSII